MFEKPESEITSEERHIGKNGLFLPILYSAGPRKIAESNAIPYAKAKELYDQFHANIPWVRQLSNPPPRSGYHPAYQPGLIERTLKKRKYLKTPWGRHLHVPQYGEHLMLNTLIQGSAADLMKLALIRTDRWVKRGDWGMPVESRMVLTVHDEIVFDGPESEIPMLHANVPALMVDPLIEEWVPLGVDHEVSTEHMAAKVAYEEWKEQVPA